MPISHLGRKPLVVVDLFRSCSRWYGTDAESKPVTNWGHAPWILSLKSFVKTFVKIADGNLL